MSENTEPQNFKQLLATMILPKVEIIGAIILITGGLFKVLGTAGYGDLLLIGFTAVAVALYLKAFLYDTNTSSPMDNIVKKIGFISCSVVLIGAMFSTLSLAGGGEMMLIGLPVLALATIFAAYRMMSTEQASFKPMLFRFVLVFAIGLLVFFEI